MEISSPPIFDFQPIKSHLNRSPKELLHQVEGEKVWKWIKNESNEGLISFTHREGAFHINIEQEKGKGFQASLPEYFEAWFDLKRDLAAFYKQVEEDGLLAPLTRELYGLRVVGVPDLFEALSWAILGQQVNLS
ncbi:MAG: DNA glycosylase, partial [Bacteroidota bacterium]